MAQNVGLPSVKASAPSLSTHTLLRYCCDSGDCQPMTSSPRSRRAAAQTATSLRAHDSSLPPLLCMHVACAWCPRWPRRIASACRAHLLIYKRALIALIMLMHCVHALRACPSLTCVHAHCMLTCSGSTQGGARLRRCAYGNDSPHARPLPTSSCGCCCGCCR